MASIPTVWRSLNELDASDIAAITVVRNRIRPKVWEAIAARHGAIPPAPTCDGDLGATIVIRIDASLIDSHSDKQHAAGNFKGGWGFHPLMAWCDNTGELLAIIPRPGNAGSNTAADHIAIIDAAIAAVPAKWRHNLLVTIDGAGSSHAVVEHLTKLNARPGWSVHYSVGFDLDERVRVAIGQPPASTWEAGARPARHGAPGRAGGGELTRPPRESVGGAADGAGPLTCGSWAAGKDDEGTRLTLSSRAPATATTCSPPPLAAGRSSGLRPATGCTPAWRDSSATPRTPGWAAGPRPVRHQHRLDHHRRPRHRPAVLDEAAPAGRAAGQGRARHAAPPAAAHRRPPDQPLPPPDPPCLPNLALGTNSPTPSTAPGHPLTNRPLPQRPQEGANHHRAHGTRSPRTTRGAVALPGTPKSRSTILTGSRPGSTRTRVKFRGRRLSHFQPVRHIGHVVVVHRWLTPIWSQ